MKKPVYYLVRKNLSKLVETWTWHHDDLIESVKKVDMVNESGPYN